MRFVRLPKILRETQHDIRDCNRHRREGQRPLVLLRSVPFKNLFEFVGDHPAYGGQSQHSKRTLADVLVQQARLEKLGLQVQSEVRLGTPVLEVLTAAEENDISAIAVATCHRSNMLEWLAVRRINEDILHQLWFPLLFFSPKG